MKILFITLSICLFSVSCGKDPKPVLSGCCTNPAIDESFGNGHIYIPNIFTPDWDGINDYLIVFGDSIHLIHSMEIRNRDGRLIFEEQEFTPGDQIFGWDGKVDGVVQKGIYTIDLNVETTNGVIKQFQGKVCNFPCGDLMMDEFITGQGCQFPSQNDNGHFNPFFATGESSDCFE